MYGSIKLFNSLDELINNDPEYRTDSRSRSMMKIETVNTENLRII